MRMIYNELYVKTLTLVRKCAGGAEKTPKTNKTKMKNL